MDDIERDFIAFHEANPVVYRTLVRLTREAIAAGRSRIGIKMLWEVMRWEMFIRTSDEASDFKLCNNYHALYARLLMAQEPDLAGVFMLRGDRPTPVIAAPRRRVTRTPSQRTLEKKAEQIGEMPTTARGALGVAKGAGASDAPSRFKNTRGASSTGTGRPSPEEMTRARDRIAARNAAAANTA